MSDLISTTLHISRMIPTPYLYPYMGFGIHQPYGIAYGGDGVGWGILALRPQKYNRCFLGIRFSNFNLDSICFETWDLNLNSGVIPNIGNSMSFLVGKCY